MYLYIYIYIYIYIYTHTQIMLCYDMTFIIFSNFSILLNQTHIVQSVPPPRRHKVCLMTEWFKSSPKYAIELIHWVNVPISTICLPIFKVAAMHVASNQSSHKTKNHLCTVHSLMMGYKMSKYHKISRSIMLNLQVGFFFYRGTSNG